MPGENEARSRALAMLALLGTAFLTASLLSFDPGDPPAEYVDPPNAIAKNWCGVVGAWLAHGCVTLFGTGSLALVVCGFGLALGLGRRRRVDFASQAAGHLMILLSAVCLIQQSVRPVAFGAAAGPGGLVGALGAYWLEHWVSRVGSLVVLLPMLLAGLVLVFDGCLYWAVGMLVLPLRLSWRLCRRLRRPRPPAPALPATPPAAPALAIVRAPDSDHADLPTEWEHPQQELRIVRTGQDEPETPIVAAPPAPASSTFCLPDLTVLDDPESIVYDNHEEEVREQARLLEKTFAEFQMRVKVVQIDTGPVVTQFEIELEPGLRARKVMALADDLAIAMRAPSVRLVAPIPGKNTVGIEVPNEHRAKVGLKELMLKASPAASGMRLPLYLGKDVKGQPMVFDLANMPHLLIAGRTGTGKSVCLNAMILSILMSRTPEQVKMLMIDPKMVELSQYKDIPHLMHPVVTDMRKAEALLGWAVEKMEERYALLARVGVRHIDAYNRLSKTEVHRRLTLTDDVEADSIPDQLPYILIFADEMADLMMTAAKEVEAHIIRLAQKSRAVGIHLCLATQKPTVDVITGLIKSNLPARIAFQVASRCDSRVVLDEMGADKLLGNGDMLFLYPGTSKIVRAQGTFVSDDEVHRVTDYLCRQGRPQFSKELIELKVSTPASAGKPSDLAGRDDMYEQAIEIVLREQRGSVSLLQRALGIGYGRAARLIDYMADDGIVGTYNGSQAREVLYTIEQWDELRESLFAKAG